MSNDPDRAESTADSHPRIEASAASYVDARDNNARDATAPTASTAPERSPPGSENDDAAAASAALAGAEK
jgi:hypothetical protein